MIRPAAVTVGLLLLLGWCLFGAAGRLSCPKACAVSCISSPSKAAAFTFLDPELLRKRAALGPGVDRGDVLLRTAQMTQRRITARMYIAAPAGRLGLRGAAARRSATWPFALVGLRATSHTCDSLCAIALVSVCGIEYG